jgi:hypothetical protein
VKCTEEVLSTMESFKGSIKYNGEQYKEQGRHSTDEAVPFKDDR